MATPILPASEIPSDDEAKLARHSRKVLAPLLSTSNSLKLRASGTSSNRKNDPTIELPASVARLMVQILGEIGRGNAVKIVPVHPELTTQEAADLLHISRPTLIQMLDSGVLPHRKVGTHRRIRTESLMAYKRKLDAERRAALAALSAYDQEIGI